MRHWRGSTGVLLFVAGGCVASPSTASLDEAITITGAETSTAVQQDVSPPLHSVAPYASTGSTKKEKPLNGLPDQPAGGTDTVVQTAATTNLATTSGLNIEGIGTGFSGPAGAFTVNSAPPDTNGAVGATQYVQWVNESFAVFDKSTGAVLYGPAAGNTLWKGFGGPCETNNDGDPTVVYDKLANRWVLSQFSVTGGPPYYQCVAVSTTSDATGTYNRYAFQQPNFNDYPKMSAWPDAYYTTFNMFSGSSFAGGRVCAFDRNAMLSGAAATQQCFQLSSSYGGLLPADVDGTTVPPVGSPNYILNFGSNVLNAWSFHVDWSNSANSTLTGPRAISVAAFNPLCARGSCVPQLGTRQKLDGLSDRLMYRLAYRNFATAGYQSLVVNHSVQANGGGGVRWYELHIVNGAPTLYQQGTFAPDSSYRWMGSVAQDKLGDIAVGYSISSSSMHPGIRYSGRTASDALGTLETENIIFSGSGSQQRNLNRWGDYSSMTVDPVDDCTFYYTNEYLQADGTFNWSTRIASFKFPGCQ